MTSIVYNSGKKKLVDGSIDLDTDTIKIALVTSAYTPNKDSHDFYDDVTNEVANGNGYTTGGKTLANKAVNQDNTNDRAEFDADDVVWTASTITARGAVIYKDTGTPSTSPLIAYIDFGADKSSSDGTFTITFNAEGILQIGE